MNTKNTENKELHFLQPSQDAAGQLMDSNESMELLQTVFDASPNHISVFEIMKNNSGKVIDFKFLMVNLQGQQASGKKNLVGQIYSTAFPHSIKTGILQTFKKVAQSGEPADFEQWFEGDGMQSWFRIIAHKVRSMLVVTTEDITERKNSAQKIEEEHRRLKEAQHIGAIGSFEWNVNAKHVEWSDELFRICGLEPQSRPITTDFLESLILIEDLPAVIAQKERSLASPGQYEINHRIKLNDGSIKWVAHRFKNFTNPEGQVVRIRGTLQDITAKKLVEQENIQMKEQLKETATGKYYELFQSIDQGFCTIQLKYDKNNKPIDYQFIEVSPSFEQQTGIKDGAGKWMRDIAAEQEEFWFETYGRVAIDRKPERFEHFSTPLNRSWSVYAFPVNEPELRQIGVLFNDITEKIKAKKKIEESEMHFKNVLLQSPNIFGILEGFPEMIISFANEPLFKSWGRTADIIGKPLLEVLPEIKEQPFPKLLQAVFETGETYYSGEEKAVIVKNGVAVDMYYLYVYQAIFDDQQKVKGVTMMATDITEQVTARRKIEENEKRFSKLLLESPFAVAILKGHDMVVTLANDAIKQIWGKGNDIENRSLFSLMPEIIEQGFATLLEQVYTTGKSYYGHEVLVKLQRNGIWEEVYFNFIYQAYKEADETISGVTILANEVTTQAIANKKIEESKSQLQNIFLNAPAALCILEGREHKYILANKAYEKLTNRKAADLLGKSIRNLFPELIGTGTFELFDKVFETGETFTAPEYPAIIDVNNEGVLRQCYFNFSLEPLKNNSGEIYAVLAMIYNITEQVLLRKQSEESGERQAFLLNFSDTLRAETTVDAVANRALQMLSVHLKLDRCYIGVYYMAEDRGEFPYQIGNERVPPMPDSVRLSDFPDALRVAFDRTLVIDDVTKAEGLADIDRQNLGALGLCALIAATLRSGEALPLWSIVAVSASARHWMPSEIKLMEDVTERTWAAIERVKAEAALRKSEHRLQRMLNIPKVGVLTFDFNGNMLHANDAFLEMVDYTRTDFNTRKFTWQDFTPQEYNEASLQVFAQLKEKGISEPYEKEYFRKDGSTIWLMFVAADLGDGTLVEYAVDISSRINAEAELKLLTEELEKKIKSRTNDLNKTSTELASNLAILQQAEKLAHIGSWEYDYPTQSFTWSEGMYILFGLPRNINLEPEIYVRSSAPDEIEAAKQTAQFIRGGLLPLPDTVCIKTPDGIKTVKLEAIVVNDAEGKPLKMIGVDMDITAELAAAKKMKEQAHFIQSTNDALPDILFVMNLHTKETIYINHSFEETLGYPEVAESSPEKNIVALIYEEDVPVIITHLEDLKNSADGEVFEIEYRLKAADGSFRWFSDRNTVFKRDSSGTPIEKIGIAQDITERKNTEKELKESNISLRYANENLQQFASIAAHDLQEPLRKIQLFTSVIKAQWTEHLPAEGQLVLHKINKAAARMSQLIKEVLDYSKIAYEGKEFAQTDLHLVLQNVFDDLDLLTEETGAQIIYNEQLPVVEANPLQIHQLFSNIITNAIKYREKERRLKIRVSATHLTPNELLKYPQLVQSGNYIQISISDNGIGFEQVYAEQIFHLFERLHNDEQFEGTGVGLALCKKITETHNGHIFALSEEGVGTEFQIILPIKQL